MDVLDICKRSLSWAGENNYAGYSKFDALSSPLLKWMSGRSFFLRAGFTFALSRMPINLRPVLLVKKNQNPKGLALFARAYFNLFEVTGEKFFKTEGLKLLDILLGLSRVSQYSGHCWGYDHPWQNSEFFIPAYEPNTVVTCNAASAFMQAYDITGEEQYLEVCRSAAEFIIADLNYIDVGENMLCLSYDLHSSWKVINVNAMASSFMAKLYKITGDARYERRSQSIMRWVISQRTPYEAWYYTDPPEASSITHDNYHTGFVLDSIFDYLTVFPGTDMKKVYMNALEFYKRELFLPNWAPKWMYDRDYPNDIHGCAQGVITFAKASAIDASYLDCSRDILEWTIRNLYSASESRFYYQKGRLGTKKFTLMRWCQAWMCYAISLFLRIEADEKDKEKPTFTS